MSTYWDRASSDWAFAAMVVGVAFAVVTIYKLGKLYIERGKARAKE